MLVLILRRLGHLSLIIFVLLALANGFSHWLHSVIHVSQRSLQLYFDYAWLSTCLLYGLALFLGSLNGIREQKLKLILSSTPYDLPSEGRRPLTKIAGMQISVIDAKYRRKTFTGKTAIFFGIMGIILSLAWILAGFFSLIWHT